MIIFRNNEKNIVETNYFNSELEKHGIMFCSVNAKCFRFLIPQKHISGDSGQKIIREMRTGKKVLINIEDNVYTFKFDDGSETPYTIELNDKCFDRCVTEKIIIEELKKGNELTVKVYAMNDSKNEMFEALELPLEYEGMFVYENEEVSKFMQSFSIVVNVFLYVYNDYIMSLNIKNAKHEIGKLATEYIFSKMKPNKNGKYIFIINELKHYLLENLNRIAKENK